MKLEIEFCEDDRSFAVRYFDETGEKYMQWSGVKSPREVRKKVKQWQKVCLMSDGDIAKELPELQGKGEGAKASH